jgi:GDPmannose 4,6-dehydratase
VHGLVRRSSSFNTKRIDHLFQDPHDSSARLFLHYGDVTDGAGITNLIYEIRPDEIYNLAAQSHVKVSFTMPHYTANVDGIGAITILEAIRSAKLFETKYYQASTSELFGSTPPPQNELSKFHPRSPYAAAKLFAYWATINYREAYNIFAVNGILFNHESPRRGETFVTRKITKAVASIYKNKQSKLYLGNMEAVRDWGYAKEYVEGMWKSIQHGKPEDFVMATGVGATVRDFCKEAFDSVGLNWEEYVELDSNYLRPSEVDALIGDSTKANNLLGWEAKTKWKDLCHIMLEADLNSDN